MEPYNHSIIKCFKSGYPKTEQIQKNYVEVQKLTTKLIFNN